MTAEFKHNGQLISENKPDKSILQVVQCQNSAGLYCLKEIDQSRISASRELIVFDRITQAKSLPSSSYDHEKELCYVLCPLKAFQNEGKIAMLYPLADGDLFDWIKAQRTKNRIKHVKEMFIKCVKAVVALHKLHIYHSDLKPENIMLRRTKTNSYIPLIGDFGHAYVALPITSSALNTPHFLDPDEKTTFPNYGTIRVKETVKCSRGTLSYVSPEVYFCENYCPAKADTWSLGVTLWSMLFCKNIWPSPDSELVRLAVTGELWKVVQMDDYYTKAMRDVFTVDLIDLFQSIFIGYESRIYPHQILDHVWFKK